MQATARFSLTEAYYRENYDQWLRHIAKWRRWTPYVACLFLAGGGLAAALGLHVAAAVGLAAGVAEFAEVLTHKSRWLAARQRGSRTDRSVQLTFTNDAIAVQGPFSSGELQWAGIERIKATSKGLFLIPQEGMHLYIPDTALSPPSVKQEIVARFQA